MNLNKAVSTPIVIEMKRTFPDLSTERYAGIQYPGSVIWILLLITFQLCLPRQKGQHRVSFCIDADNKVSEIYETNNCITKDFFIYEDEIRPVYPYNYGIVNRQGIKFQASSANPSASSRLYRMELDTTQLFNSPIQALTGY